MMRGWLLQNLGRAGLTAGTDELSLGDLRDADEIWLSNAVIGARRVAEIADGRWSEWPLFDRLKSLGVPAPGW